MELISCPLKKHPSLLDQQLLAPGHAGLLFAADPDFPPRIGMFNLEAETVRV